MKVILLSLVVFNILFKNVQNANILFVATMSSPSHHIWHKQLILGLIDKGHNVTSITHLKEPHAVNNWTIITIEGLYDVLPKLYDMDAIIKGTVIDAIKLIYEYSKVVCEYDLESKGLQMLLNYPKNAFDLIVFDVTLGQCMYPIIEWFNSPPVVAIYLLPLLKSRKFGSHIYPSYMPYFSTSFTDEMTFTERFVNFMYAHFDDFYFHYFVQPTEFKLAQKTFGKNIRPFEDVEKGMSLILTNIDPNLDYPISLPPNIIPLGGLQIRAARKLPDDLQNIMDNSMNGVILVSFGTNVRSEYVDETVFFEAFRQLNQTVVWKYEVTDKEKLPGNVIARKWLPQDAILAHPNTKLFVSQCGGFSYQEAIYHAVPLVAVPYIIDQYSISQRLAKRKLAAVLDHWDLTAEKLYGAIDEVLQNPEYRQNMKIASKRYRDQPQSPLERGLFWIEYVLRHGSADHLVPIARNMTEYQLENFDVYLFLGCSLIMFYFVLVFLSLCCKFLYISIYEQRK